VFVIILPINIGMRISEFGQHLSRSGDHLSVFLVDEGDIALGDALQGVCDSLDFLIRHP
jgi:hypothetical protein